jgi:hypothetical protein
VLVGQACSSKRKKTVKLKNSLSIVGALTVLLGLAACAVDPGGRDGVLNSNAAQVHVYTAAEKSGMSPDGITNRIILPSEIKSYMENKETPPTGEVNYCDAGLSQLVQARRNEALAAIAGACGGEDKYRVRREGLGSVKARYLGNFQLTPSCTRSKVVVFKCTGPEPKPDMSK